MLNKIMSHFPAVKANRRSFILGAAAAGAALFVGFRPAGAATSPLSPYLRIDPDNKVTILSSQFEMGQGAYFGIATLVNEELGADWADITVEGGSGDAKLFGNLAWGGAAQGTGGSTSMVSSWERYRKAGAAARAMLVAAAAKAWSVPEAEITAERAGSAIPQANPRPTAKWRRRRQASPLPLMSP